MPVTSMLVIHGVLAIFAVKRGWRAAPLALLALPWVLMGLAPALPPLIVAGWWLPYTNLLVGVGTVSTLALVYTALIEPEPA